MLDVFISYVNEDRLKAHSLAKILEQANWSVWWDRRISAGQPWETTILAQVNAAKCIVVLWSRESVKSEWVRREAAVGDEKGNLIPVLLQPADLPTPTPHLQGFRLSTWSSYNWSEELRPLLESVKAKVGHGELPDLSVAKEQARATPFLERIARVEAVQAALDYCALAFVNEARRQEGRHFSEDDFARMRGTYDRLKIALSGAEGPIGDEDFHELLGRFMSVLSAGKNGTTR